MTVFLTKRRLNSPTRRHELPRWCWRRPRKKAQRGELPHLGELRSVALYDNDRQIEEIRYRWEDAAERSYSVRLWALEGE